MMGLFPGKLHNGLLDLSTSHSDIILYLIDCTCGAGLNGTDHVQRHTQSSAAHLLRKGLTDLCINPFSTALEAEGIFGHEDKQHTAPMCKLLPLESCSL